MLTEEVKIVNWINQFQHTIAYIENHLLEDIQVADIVKEMQIPYYYFQQGFQAITGYSVMEYIRCRRLYMAALRVLSKKMRIIDIALSYGYGTPESFTKAFSRFHGVSPMQLREHPEKLRVFLPLQIRLSLKGGDDMDYVVEKMEAFTLIGVSRQVKFASAYQDIPVFWDEFCKKYCQRGQEKAENADAVEQAILDGQLGEYGVCLDDLPEKGNFRYLIAGLYRGGAVVKGLELIEFPRMEWVKFRCTGPLPTAMQAVNSRIYSEWLPNNPEYEIAMGANIEWYTKGDVQALDYMSEIWIPVQHREDSIT